METETLLEIFVDGSSPREDSSDYERSQIVNVSIKRVNKRCKPKTGAFGYYIPLFGISDVQIVVTYGSTECELLAFDHACKLLQQISYDNVVIYTDCKLICDLFEDYHSGRLTKLHQHDYRMIINHFRRFPHLIVEKVQGHPSRIQTNIEKNFSVVDQLTHNAMKKAISPLPRRNVHESY